MSYRDRASLLAAMLVAFLLSPAAALAAQQEIRVELYTMGPGDYLFSKFGHVALCVSDEVWRRGRCFNYGTADFSTPGPLTWAVLRGRAEFWVSVSYLDEMIRLYRTENRTIYRQGLPLSQKQAAAMKRALAISALPENRTYRYDHFFDNCSTRPRDHIDEVTGGSLRANPAGDANSYTFRALVRESLKTEPLFFLLAEAFLGRPMDRERSEYEAMFLPHVLRDAVRTHLLVPPEVVYARQEAPSRPSRIATHRLALAVGIGLAGGLIIFLSPPRLSSGVRRLFASLFGTLGSAGWALAILSPLPELRYNESLLVFLPTDFFLLLSPMRAIFYYSGIRVAELLLLVLLLSMGVLIQPLGAFLALTLPVLAGMGVRALAAVSSSR